MENCASDVTHRELVDAMKKDLEAIERTFMPFGKFGPKQYPPKGLPICDLPAEYLGWFAAKSGWPKGRLGELLRIVHQMKADGSDMAFDEIRKKAGGQSALRKPRQKNFDFTEPPERQQPPLPFVRDLRGSEPGK